MLFNELQIGDLFRCIEPQFDKFTYQRVAIVWGAGSFSNSRNVDTGALVAFGHGCVVQRL